MNKQNYDLIASAVAAGINVVPGMTFDQLRSELKKRGVKTIKRKPLSPYSKPLNINDYRPGLMGPAKHKRSAKEIKYGAPPYSNPLDITKYGTEYSHRRRKVDN